MQNLKVERKKNNVELKQDKKMGRGKGEIERWVGKVNVINSGTTTKPKREKEWCEG